MSKKVSKVEEAPTLRLNKYISNCGYCSRREADKLITEGKVKINNIVIKELGTIISINDEVKINGTILKNKRNIYILLNKPKDVLCTTEDDRGRRTVMDLLGKAIVDRVYPVGRLDRNTTGLLLLTNDGDLSQKMTHPKYGIEKIYQVTLDKQITQSHFEKLVDGSIVLEDGNVEIDEAVLLNNERTEIGIKIHSGRNRIIRRTFESIGYEVVKLDRVSFGSLTKRLLPRGKWRFLTEKEVGILHRLCGKIKK